MSKYGLTADGFLKKDFSTIRDERRAQVVAYFGKINLDAPSVFSQLIDIPSYFESQIWEKAEAIYNAMYPNTAEGYSLDGISAIAGISRLSSTYTTAVCQITGVNNTLIPALSEISVENTQSVFILDTDTTLTNEKCYSIDIQVRSSISLGDVVSLNLNGTSFSYTKEESDTPESIALNLRQLVDDAGLYIVSGTGNIITVTSNNIGDTFSCFVSDFLLIISVTNNAAFTSKVSGAISAPSLSLNTINTPISGWTLVNNIQAGATGRNIETDIELRSRLAISRTRGSGSLEAIRSRILNLTGVTSVTIVENNTNAEVDGLPAKSFQTLVLGGDDNDIAKEIWLSKPAGIQTYGNTTVQVIDSQEKPHTIEFSRSTNLFIYTSITLTVNDNYLSNYTDIIKNLIVNKINSIGVGVDVIYQSLFASVYSVPGIENAVIKLASSLDESDPPNPESYLSANIVVAVDRIAKTDTSKISITGV